MSAHSAGQQDTSPGAALVKMAVARAHVASAQIHKQAGRSSEADEALKSAAKYDARALPSQKATR